MEEDSKILPKIELKTERPVLKCPDCRREFSLPDKSTRIRSDTSHNGTFLAPYLLKCGHSICYKCIYHGLNNNKIICRVCQEIFVNEKIEKTRTIRDKFPYNYYLQGVLTTQNENKFLEMKKKLKAEKLKMGNFCNECSEVETDHYCQTCQLFFCKNCFNKLHLMTVSFSSHKLLEFGKSDEKLIEKVKQNCATHSLEKIYLCAECNLLICSLCKLAQKHLHHNVKEIDEVYKVNQQTRDEALQSLMDGLKSSKEMIKT
uniref:CSON008679 protein n=1 Tax=Culicoides sonorensis TaxID=179676 RepID=A0A336LFD3_CULSO